MKYSNEQIMNLSTEELIFMKGKVIEVELKNGTQVKGVVENLIEASISHPSNLIGAIIINGKKIEISQINNIELIY